MSAKVAPLPAIIARLLHPEPGSFTEYLCVTREFRLERVVKDIPYEENTETIYSLIPCTCCKRARENSNQFMILFPDNIKKIAKYFRKFLDRIEEQKYKLCKRVVSISKKTIHQPG